MTNAAPEDEAKLAAIAASLVGDMFALFVGSTDEHSLGRSIGLHVLVPVLAAGWCESQCERRADFGRAQGRQSARKFKK